MALLSYEHMFPSSRTSSLRQRALDALDLARSFLLLEDDYSVDWEVDQAERAHLDHPHRAPLRGRLARRRSGQLAHAPQHCISPVSGTHARYASAVDAPRHALREAQPCRAQRVASPSRSS
jgi:hypothetical protein